MFLPRTICKLLVTYALLTGVVVVFGNEYAQLWLTAIAGIVEHLCPFIDVINVGTATTAGEHWFELRGVTRVALALPEGTIPAGSEMSAATLQGHAFIHVLMIGSLAAVSPRAGRLQRFKFVTAIIAAIAVATLLDIPFTLAGAASAEVSAALGGDDQELVGYYHFIEAGGRPFLSLLAAAGVILISSSGQKAVGEHLPIRT